MIEFILNNKIVQTDLSPGITVLDFVRYEKNLKGTKIGCREGDCGACIILVGELSEGKVNYRSMTSCLTPLGNVAGKHIVTVEGINMDELSQVQKAIIDEGGTQCGFCTVGFVMSFTGFCMSSKPSNYENAIAAVDGNICRCTGYKSLERAGAELCKQLSKRDNENTLSWLTKNNFIPSYFSDIHHRLKEIQQKKELKTTEKINVGGGTDLYVQKHDTIAHANINFVFDNEDLKGIKKKNNFIEIGASSTVEDLRSSNLINEIFPDLMKHTKLVSSTPIRNMATLAGNFVNASPIGDMTIFFLALDAEITLTNNYSSRTIKLRDFYKGYKTLDKTEDEIINCIRFEIPSANTKFSFEKVCKRTHLDIASANAALSIELNDNKITKAHASAGGVFAYPLYLKETSAFLTGKTISSELIIEANEILQKEIAPISDARGASDYKRLLSRQLFFSNFILLFPEKIKADDLFFTEA